MENFLMVVELSFPEITKKYDAAKGELGLERVENITGKTKKLGKRKPEIEQMKGKS